MESIAPEAMREKARLVLGAMEQRMAALGFGWADVTATQVYTVFDIHPLLADEIIRRGATVQFLNRFGGHPSRRRQLCFVVDSEPGTGGSKPIRSAGDSLSPRIRKGSSDGRRPFERELPRLAFTRSLGFPRPA
jgi:hypothetical protein